MTRSASPPRPTPRPLFVALCVAAFGLLAATNHMIATYAPLGVKQIGASYLIAFWHVPSAAAMLLAYLAVGVCGVFWLVTKSPAWDLRGRTSAAVGLLANGVVLLTGMVWGKAAWNVWWRFDDPRLTISAIVFLVYLAYAVLARGIDDEEKRPRILAIYGILATPSYVLVQYAVKWFGAASHPSKVDMKGTEIAWTFTVAHVAFLALYVVLWIWKYDLETLRDRAEAALGRVRRLEDSRS